jgi:hypothetical protein
MGSDVVSANDGRIVPISRSAKPFCRGEAGVAGLSRMPMARNRRVTMADHSASLGDSIHDQSSFHRLLIGMRQLGTSPRWRDGIGDVTLLPSDWSVALF